MAFKRSGKVLIVTIVMLLGFSLFVIWHNKPLSQTREQAQEALGQLVQQYPDLGVFIDRLELPEGRIAFYSLGLKGQHDWPVNIFQACYSDPIAAQGQFSPLKDSYGEEIELIRYRSLEDFILILQKAESDQPGFIAGLDLQAHRPLPENPLGISIGLVFALCLGITGTFLVRKTAG